jgi:ubiquitin-like-conjugating enzyme ATG3
MKKVIERMNSSVVEEQLAAQRNKAGKDKDGSGKKKWPFSRKSLPGPNKDDASAVTTPGEEEGQVEGMRVDFYLVVFLKFIASIVPTIEVDSTTAF